MTADASPHTMASTTVPTEPAQDRTWQLTLRVIDLARGLLVSNNPYLSSSIGLLELAPAALPDPYACDGKTLYLDAAQVLSQFSQHRTAPVHDLAHVLLHCLLLHPFVDGSVDATAWDLATDIVVEGLVAEVVGTRPGLRGEHLATVLKQLAADFDGPVTAERLYRALRNGAYASNRSEWSSLAHVDGHQLWPPARASQTQTQGARGDSDSKSGNADASTDTSPTGIQQGEHDQAQEGASEQRQSGERTSKQFDGLPDESAEHGTEAADGERSPSEAVSSQLGPLTDAQRSQAEQTWSRAAQSMRVDLQTISRTRGSGLGGLVRELEVESHERIDYRDFLRQFAVEHEDMRLSDDEFDYIFYTYGLDLYGNVPLVEPLEYRNEKRIRDFAIVIDTSSSVQTPVVQEFVNTTFDVLSSEGDFFSQTNIHIIQADARVQSDAKITCLADLDRWRRTIKLHGFGGTDFRPAFAYVQKLRQFGEFDDLQGLIYFTDGWGIYPERMPPYKCAFVFYDEDHRPDLVPPWAIQLVLHPGEYESLSVY